MIVKVNNLTCFFFNEFECFIKKTIRYKLQQIDGNPSIKYITEMSIWKNSLNNYKNIENKSLFVWIEFLFNKIT